MCIASGRILQERLSKVEKIVACRCSLCDNCVYGTAAQSIGPGSGRVDPELPPQSSPKEKKTTPRAGKAQLAPATSAQDSFLDVSLEEIAPSPENPRHFYDDAKLQELSQSIQAQGLIQPLVVRPRVESDAVPPQVAYVLIAGERRFRAAQRAHIQRVPVVVKDVTPRASFELALPRGPISLTISVPTQEMIGQFGVEEFGAPLFTPDSAAWREANPPAAGAALKITGSVANEMSWTEEEVRAMPTIDAESTNKEGETKTYTGVLINDLLALAGPNADATTVVFVADDGYTAEATLAALHHLRADGWVGAHETVVLFNTGSGLK